MASSPRKPWYKRWFPLALLELNTIRERMRRENLHSTADLPTIDGHPASCPVHKAEEPSSRIRSFDGSGTDANDPKMGMVGTRLGRNVPLGNSYPDTDNILKPNPRKISRELLTRRAFVPAEQLNVLAAAWIQFMQHGWFTHTDPNEKPNPVCRMSADNTFKVDMEKDDPWPEHIPADDTMACPHAVGEPMEIRRTPADPTRPSGSEDQGPPTYVNRVSHWWDASQLYGCDAELNRKLRTGVDGKMKLGEDRQMAYHSDKGSLKDIPVVAFRDNWWLGLGLLYKVFILEHNAICDALKVEYPSWEDEQLFQKARLIIAAILAKIHTIEWTPGLLATPETDMAMNANWYGFKREKRPFARILLGGILGVGSKLSPKLKKQFEEALNGILETEADHHAAEYAMTEEFAAMYRLHALIPDYFTVLSSDNGQEFETYNLYEVSGNKARSVLEKYSLEDLLYTFGVNHPGALRLHNYPVFLQNLHRDNGDVFDLGAIDILRDRERGIPRYNEFREKIGMTRVNSFDELTDNPEWGRQIRELYNDDLDSVDLMVGMYAEPLIPGFAISETAFRIFILMASRRLKSDRFFTEDYTAETYTQLGLDWIEKNNMRSIILRHCVELEPALKNTPNAFAPWEKVMRGNNKNG